MMSTALSLLSDSQLSVLRLIDYLRFYVPLFPSYENSSLFLRFHKTSIMNISV
jgi:hypothetical protein